MKSVGRLWYSGWPDGPRLVVEVDPELSRYYRTLIPRQNGVKPQKWPPHITIVRNEPVLSPAWGAHEKEYVEFDYDPIIMSNDTYYWLNVTCDRLTNLRLELGLPASSEWSRPPDGSEFFHTTLGNTKPLLK